MDYGKVMLDAWHVMRRTSALWGLALISSVQVLLYTIIVAGLIVPLSVVTQLLVQAQTYDSARYGAAQPAVFAAGRAALTDSIIWVDGHSGPLVAGVVGLTMIWALFGVYDVAATGGIIAQTEAATRRLSTSAGAGLREGFRVWWRTVGLLAIAALPSLAYMMAIALVTLFTVSLPVDRGQVPDAAAMSVGNALTTPLSILVTILGIPLSILVALGLRFAILGECAWKEAFGRAWRLAKVNLVEVGLMYVVLLVALTLFSFALTLAIVVVSAIAAILVAALMSSSGGVLTGGSIFVIALASLFAIVAFLGTTALGLLWQSVAWTVFWRRLTGRETRHETAYPSAVAIPPASS